MTSRKLPSGLRALGIALSFVLAFPTSVSADLQDQLDGMFDGMINVTDPQVVDGQRRGVLFGGSLEGRFRVMRPRLVALTPPSISASCNGISAYMGSFSLISSEEFTQLLRTIGQNAAGYAFELAISSICPTCQSLMDALQKKIQDWTKGLQDSCSMVKNGFNKLGMDSVIQDSMNNNWLEGAAQGLCDDVEGCRSPTTGTDPTTYAAQNATPAYKIDHSFNVVMEAIQKHQIQTWFGTGGDFALREAIMNVTGTIIVTIINDGPEFRVLDPRLDLKDFYLGTTSTGNPDGAPYYHCIAAPYTGGTATAEQCLDVAELPDGVTPGLQLVGMRDRVRTMILGGVLPDGTNTIGILGKWVTNAALDENEQAFISSLPQPVLSFIRNLAAEPGLSRLAASQTTDVIALAITVSLFEEILKGINAALTAMDEQESVAATNIVTNIAKVREQMSDQYAQLADQLSAVTSTFELYDLLMKSLAKSPHNVARNSTAPVTEPSSQR